MLYIVLYSIKLKKEKEDCVDSYPLIHLLQKRI